MDNNDPIVNSAITDQLEDLLKEVEPELQKLLDGVPEPTRRYVETSVKMILVTSAVMVKVSGKPLTSGSFRSLFVSTVAVSIGIADQLARQIAVDGVQVLYD